MRKKFGVCLLVLICLLGLAGCGKGEEFPSVGAQGAAVGLSADTGERLYVNACIPLYFQEQNTEGADKSFFYDTCGSSLYVLWGDEGNSPKQLSLYIFDGESKETEQHPFTLQLSGREDGYIASMDVQGGERLSFRMADKEGDFLVVTDMEGNVLSRQEPFPDREEYPWNGDALHRFENRLYDNEGGPAVLSRCREQENRTELFWYDTESGEESPMAVFDEELVRSLCMESEDILYYTTIESLNRWNRRDNTRTRLLELHANGISASPSSNNLMVNSLGEILVCEMEGEIPCVFVLSGEEPKTEDRVRIAFLASVGADSLSRPLQIFAHTHPEYGLTQEKGSDDMERQALRDRVFVELAAGRGPELMWVSRQDMYALNEKGLLMDVYGLLGEDVREQLLPCVIASGTLEDRMVGVKLHSYYETVFVPDELWEGDSWTVSDVMGLMESREDWVLPFSYAHGGSISLYDPYELLSRVLLSDLDGSEFLDTKRGYCCFDTEEFIRLLELCKKYGRTERLQMDTQEWYEQLKGVESIAHIADLEGILGFSYDMSMYDGSAHMVGFPTRDGGKNYISGRNSYLVVNARAEHLEEIKELLAYLLSYEQQFADSPTSVRRDVIRDSVVYNEFWETIRLKVSYTQNISMELELKPNGDSWLEEYLAFLETCEPEQDWRYSPVGTILSEELQPYFAGDKSAREVVGIIQSRVQIYLGESR